MPEDNNTKKEEEERKPTPINSTLLQGFEWHTEKNHWKRLEKNIDNFAAIGITNVWIPPPCKASNPDGTGYDIYDLYDLGEFDQKGAVATKWGTKEELESLCKKAGEKGIGIYLDAVLNHKAGADHKERCRVVEVDTNNRNEETSEPYEIEGWLGFDFPGRGEKYSKQKYHWEHFSGTDYNAENEKTAIYRILGDNKHWSSSVSDENGNGDFLMFADLDYSHPEVEADVLAWGKWVVKELGLKGFRFDAVQHFSQRFTINFCKMLAEEFGDNSLFLVGEVWDANVDNLTGWLDTMDHKFSLFDAALVNNFSTMSKTEKADLRTVFDKTLTQVAPTNSVTCVANHDTQKGQTVETLVEGFFIPLAYAFILLRVDGYPIVFFGHLYGTKGPHAEPAACGGKLGDLALARHLYAYGELNDYNDDPNCIGWVRRGTWDKPDGCAVIMSNAEPGQIRMFVGEEHKGETWTDILGWAQDPVKIGDDGFGEFKCPGVSMGVYVNEKAEGRDGFGKFDDQIYKEG